jgi:O-antigen/teichoic acid export membrane protein
MALPKGKSPLFLMSRLRKAARATVAVQIFSGVSTILSLITVPLYLAWLGQERYGLLLTGLAFSGYLMFSDAGLNWASMLLIAQANGREERSKVASIVRNSFPLAACSALLVILLITGGYFVLTKSQSVTWLPSHPEFPGLLLAIGAGAVASLGLGPFYNLLIGLQDTTLAAIYQGSGRITGTLAAVVMAWVGAPLGGVYAGNIAGTLLAGLLAAIHCRRRHPWAFAKGPFWEPSQIRQQLRTGLKSLTMQAGNVLWGTAPVFAISFVAGARFVPSYSIPMTLLNAPLGVISSFSANLQPGYGEAMGRGDLEWVAGTVQQILRRVLLILGLLGCGFTFLSAPFVSLWTEGRIGLSPVMIGNVLFLAFVASLVAVFRFALTGINRHRFASLTDLAGGILAMIAAPIIVARFGYEWSGSAVALIGLFTCGAVMPRELRKSLTGLPLFPPFAFHLRLLAVVAITSLAASLTRYFYSQDTWISIGVAGLVITGTFLAAAGSLLPAETRFLKDITAPILKRRSN